MEQVRANIVDEEGYMQFTYSQEDLDSLLELKKTAEVMTDNLLYEVENVIIHFSDSLMVPIN